MGIAAFVLFNIGKSIRIPKLLEIYNDISKNEKLFYSGNVSEYGLPSEINYCEIAISDISLEESYGRSILLCLANEPYNYRNIDFKWDLTNQEYFKSIITGDFYENEDLLFKFIYPFLTKCPEAKLWIEDDWFYTLSDLENIASKPFDKEWCYKNPKLL